MNRIIDLCTQYNVTIEFEPNSGMDLLKINITKGCLRKTICTSYSSINSSAAVLDEYIMVQIISAIEEINAYFAASVLEKEKKGD